MDEDAVVVRLMAIGPRRDPEHAQSYRNEAGLRGYNLDYLRAWVADLEARPEHAETCRRDCFGEEDECACPCHTQLVW